MRTRLQETKALFDVLALVVPKDCQQKNDWQRHAQEPKQYPASKSHDGPPQLTSANKRRPTGRVPLGNSWRDVSCVSPCWVAARGDSPFPAQAFRRSPCPRCLCYQAARFLFRPAATAALVWAGRVQVSTRPARALRRTVWPPRLSACAAPPRAAAPFRREFYQRQRWPPGLSAASRTADQGVVTPRARGAPAGSSDLAAEPD